MLSTTFPNRAAKPRDTFTFGLSELADELCQAFCALVGTCSFQRSQRALELRWLK